MRYLIYIGGALVALWVTFRVTMIVRRVIRRRRAARPEGVCPSCGSGNLDDYSDAESGMCRACGHVWGVSKNKQS